MYLKLILFQHTLSAIRGLTTLRVLRLVGDAAYLLDDAQELSRLSGVHEHVARVQLLQTESGIPMTSIFLCGYFSKPTWCRSVFVILNSGLSSETDDRTESEAVSAL